MESNNSLDQMEQIAHQIIRVLFPAQSVFLMFLSVSDKVSLLNTLDHSIHFVFPKISFEYNIN